MKKVQYGGDTFRTCESGFIDSFDNFNDAWIYYVAEEEGVPIVTDDHLHVVDSLRTYYQENGIAPMVRILSVVTGFSLKQIYELFPSGPLKGAVKMAGLPKASGCA